MEARLFFEFLQVAIGNRESLSRVLSDNEWQDIFRLLKEHALIGVSFSAVERLHAKGMVCPMQLRMQWYALVVQIERRNEQLNGLCKKVTEQYEHDGLATCILKGQGNILNYPKRLGVRRQSGDIDVWATPINDEGLRIKDRGIAIAVLTGKNEVEYVEYHGHKAIREYVRMLYRLQGLNTNPKARYHHIDAPDMDGVKVDVHYRPTFCRSFIRNRRMQKWFDIHASECMSNRTSDDFAVPTASFNMVYQMAHLFEHYFEGGIGLRQMMDYHYTLKAWQKEIMEWKSQQSQGMWSEGLGTPVMSKDEVMAVLRSFGMGKFAAAVMWVLNEVFGGVNENENNPLRTRRGSNENDNDNENNPQRTRWGSNENDNDNEKGQQRTRRGSNENDNDNEKGPRRTRRGSNENENDNENNPQRTRRDTDGCPQADGVGEEVSINDERLMINDCPWLLCEPNEVEGRKLLNEIMQGGKFGQYDTRDAELKRGGMVKHGVWKVKRVMRLVRSYPEEALWEPVFRVWHLGWRLLKGY